MTLRAKEEPFSNAVKLGLEDIGRRNEQEKERCA